MNSDLEQLINSLMTKEPERERERIKRKNKQIEINNFKYGQYVTITLHTVLPPVHTHCLTYHSLALSLSLSFFLSPVKIVAFNLLLFIY